MDGLLLSIVYGILGMLGYGISGAIAKVPLARLDVNKGIFLRNTFSSGILLIMLLFSLDTVGFTWPGLGIAIITTFIGWFGLIGYFFAIKKGKIGVIAPIANSAGLVTVLLSLIFFKEKLSSMQGLAILLIIAGVVLISINFKNFKGSDLFSKAVAGAFLACIMWGVFFFLFKIPSLIFGAVLTALIMEFANFVQAGVVIIIRRDFKMPNKKIWKYMALVGCIGGLGTMFYSLGIMKGNVSIVAPLVLANPFIMVIYGKFVYGERLRLTQDFGIIVTILGIILLSL